MYEKAIQSVIDTIEQHLTEEITLEQCSQAAGYSMYHLHRLFSLYVGKNVMEYLRERRLHYAMRDISQGMRILDTAILYGYQSERGFSRAFLKYFGRTPGQCRGSGYLLVSPLQVKELKTIGGKIMENYLSEIFFETLEDMTVVSAVMVSQNPEDEVIDFLTKWVKENGLTTTGRAFGFDVPVTMAQQEAGMRGYEYWISIDQCIKDTDQVKCKKIAGTKYAVLTIEDPFQNPFERIPKGWGRMVEWIKENQLDQVAYSGNRYCMEEVTEVNGKQFMAIYSAVE